jgi:hypothetical protein
MSSKVLLALTVLVYMTMGNAPRMREVRNPDAEQGCCRVMTAQKRQSV